MAAVTHPPPTHSSSSISPIIREMTVPIADILGGAKLEPLSPPHHPHPTHKPFPSLSLRPTSRLGALSNSRPSLSPVYPSPSHSPPQHIIELIRPFCEPIDSLLPGGRISSTLGPIVGQKRKIVSDLQSNLAGGLPKRRRTTDDFPTKLPKPVSHSRSQSPEAICIKPSHTPRVSGAPVSPLRVPNSDRFTPNRRPPDSRLNTQHSQWPDRVTDPPKPLQSASQSPKPFASKPSHPIRTSGAPVSPQRDQTADKPTFNQKQLDGRAHTRKAPRLDRVADPPRPPSLSRFPSPDPKPSTPKQPNRTYGAPVSPRIHATAAKSINRRQLNNGGHAQLVQKPEPESETPRPPSRSVSPSTDATCAKPKQKHLNRTSVAPVSPTRDSKASRSDVTPKQSDTRRHSQNIARTDRSGEKRKRRHPDEVDFNPSLPPKRQRSGGNVDNEGMDESANVGKEDAVKLPRRNTEGKKDYNRDGGQDRNIARERRSSGDKVEARESEKRMLDDRNSERNLPLLRSVPDKKGDKRGNRQGLDEDSPGKEREKPHAVSKRGNSREHSAKREMAGGRAEGRDTERKRKPDGKEGERNLPMLRSISHTKGDKMDNRNSLDEQSPVKRREESSVKTRRKDEKDRPKKRDGPKLVSEPPPRQKRPEGSQAKPKDRPATHDSKPPRLESRPTKLESKPMKRHSDTEKRESRPPKPDSKSARDRSPLPATRSSRDDARPEHSRRKQGPRDRERDRELEGDRERNYGRDRDRDRTRPRGSDRDRGKDRDWDRNRDSHRGRDEERDVDRERDRGSERDRRRRVESRGGRESSRTRDRTRDNDRDRDRPRDRDRDSGCVRDRERDRGRDRNADVEGDRVRRRDRDRRDRDWEKPRDARNRDREAERDRLRPENDRRTDRERSSRQSRSETEVKTARAQREKERKRDKDTGDSHTEGGGDRLSGKERDAAKAEVARSRPGSGQGSVGSRNNPRADERQGGSASKNSGPGNSGQGKMELSTVRALRRDLEKRTKEATALCDQRMKNKEYDLYEGGVKEAFRLSFEWGLAMESELRLLEHVIPAAERVVKKREIIMHYRNLTRRFATSHCKQLETLKRKNAIAYLRRGRTKAYLRMFGLQRMWEREQRHTEGEARKAAGEEIAARKNGGKEETGSNEMPLDKLVRLKEMADDYGNLISLLEGVLVDDGDGVEGAGTECSMQ